VLEVHANISSWGVRYDGELPFAADLELEPVDWDEFRKWLIWLESWTGRPPDIYTGAWFYSHVGVKPIPDWVSDYNHWLTGYNDDGPSVWGPMAEVNPFITCWQQNSSWEVPWCEKNVDRNYWWAGSAHLVRYSSMAKKVVNVDDLLELIQDKGYDAIPVDSPVQDFSIAWPAPSPKVVTQWYGINPQFYPGQKGHEGIDIRAVTGAAITAAADGKVYRVEKDPNSGPYGIQVRVEHDTPSGKFKTIYAHLKQAMVDLNDVVIAGQVIATSDNTGNSSGAHLHLALKKVGEGSDWLGIDDIVNPVPYFPDLFPNTTIPGFTGQGWLVDVGGNFRTSPHITNNIIRLIQPGETLHMTGLIDGDWWECNAAGRVGWFWNPGYKLRAL